MFNHSSKDGYSTPLEGIEMKTLVHGEKTLMVEFSTLLQNFCNKKQETEECFLKLCC